MLFSTESIEERWNGTFNNHSKHFLFKNVSLSSLYLVQIAKVQVDFISSKRIPWVCLREVTNKTYHIENYQNACFNASDSLSLVRKLRELPRRISGILQLNFSVKHPTNHFINKVELVMKYPGEYFCLLFETLRAISVAI